MRSKLNLIVDVVLYLLTWYSYELHVVTRINALYIHMITKYTLPQWPLPFHTYYCAQQSKLFSPEWHFSSLIKDVC